MKTIIRAVCVALTAAGCAAAGPEAQEMSGEKKSYEVQKSEKEWKEALNPEAYRVLRQAGTEPAFDNEYWDNKEKGIYKCAGCGQPVFSSAEKFKSGTGWPSFWQPIEKDAVGEKMDRSFFMVRTEVHCSRCGGHLGHVFNDGPQPTSLRYCINSAALEFEEAGSR